MNDSTRQLDDPELAEHAEAAEPLEFTVPPRRGFFKKALAVVIGTVVGLVPAGVGLAVFIDPLRRKGKSGDAGFVKVTTLDSLPSDGMPQFFNVVADRTDAWTHYRNVPIGGVFLRLGEDGKIEAFSASCPHAGCYVGVRDDGSFKCPCHESEFEPDGQRRPINASGKQTVAPRGLDTLQVKASDNGRFVLVKFQKFLPGHEEKIAIS